MQSRVCVHSAKKVKVHAILFMKWSSIFTLLNGLFVVQSPDHLLIVTCEVMNVSRRENEISQESYQGGLFLVRAKKWYGVQENLSYCLLLQ